MPSEARVCRWRSAVPSVSATREYKNGSVIPLGDSVPRRQQPVVTQALIAACVLVFLYELSLRGLALDRFIERWGAVPRIVLAALAGDPRVPRTELVTLLTSEFLHAGFVHLGGNMLFLWVFGRAVEDRLGHAVYLLFYLLVVLVLAFWFLTQFVNGVSAITRASSATEGVAFWAHVTGFLLGAASARL